MSDKVEPLMAIEKCIAMLSRDHHETKAAARTELAELRRKAELWDELEKRTINKRRKATP